MNYYISNSDYLMHHGVKGMKWGVRRYQNYDGTRIKGTQSISSGQRIFRGSSQKPKWGNKRYQNADGSLTDAGKKAYYDHHKVGDVEWDSLNDRGRQVQYDYRKKSVISRADTVAYNTKKVNDTEYLDTKAKYQNNMYRMQYGHVADKIKNSNSMTKEELSDAWAGSKDAVTYQQIKDEYVKQVERVVKEGYGSLYDKPYKSIDPSPYNKQTTLGEEICKEILRQTEWEYYTARDEQKTIRPKL